jgi:hypothetical protein
MLKLLSSLEIGDTINITTMSKVSHDSYMTATTRWLYGENRHRTMTMIEEEITSTLLQLHKVFSFSSCYDLSEAYQGIENLSITYQGDKEIVTRLRKCMEAISKYLESVGHINLLEIKKNSKSTTWKRFYALLMSKPNLIRTKWMKKLAWRIVNVCCIAGGKILEPLLEDANKRSKAMKFVGPLALKYLLLGYYSKTKFLNLILKVILFSISSI